MMPLQSPTSVDAQISRRTLLAGAFGSIGAVLLAGRPTSGLRQLLGSVSIGAAAETEVSDPIASSQISLSGIASSMTSSLSDFAPHVGSRFNLVTKLSGLVPVTLIEAVASPARSKGVKPISGEAFSLLFEGVAGAVVAQGAFAIRHEVLPESTYFISPVGRGLKVQDYQVVIDQRIFASGSAPKKEG
jgi:hypothetical protein